MQREISNKVTLGDTLNPYEDARGSIAIDRTASNYNDAKEKVQKKKTLSKLVGMIRILQNTYLAFSSLLFRACLKI